MARLLLILWGAVLLHPTESMATTSEGEASMTAHKFLRPAESTAEKEEEATKGTLTEAVEIGSTADMGVTRKAQKVVGPNHKLYTQRLAVLRRMPKKLLRIVEAHHQEHWLAYLAKGPPHEGLKHQEQWLAYLANNEEAIMQVSKFWNALDTLHSLTDTFKVEEMIGSGCSGSVFRARDRHSDSQVALKCLPKSDLGPMTSQWLVSEYLRQRGVAGVALIEEQAYAVTRSEDPQFAEQLAELGKQRLVDCPMYKSGYAVAESKPQFNNSICLVEPLMALGNLNPSTVSPETTFKCLNDVAATLAALHKNHVTHNDVFLFNIMLEKQNNIISGKLVDLGAASISYDPAPFQKDARSFVQILRVSLAEYNNKTIAMTPARVRMFDVWKKIVDGGSQSMSGIAQMMGSAGIKDI